MNEALLKLLKEYLTVHVNVDRGSYGDSDRVTVTLKLDGEDISESFDYLPTTDNR